MVLAASLVALWDGALSATAASADDRTIASALRDSAPPAPAGLGTEGDVPAPTRVRAGSVDIDAEMIPLGKHDDGRLEVPEDADLAGWWTGRANPGGPGPSVVVGHVDSREGPGVFWDLGDLEAGDRVSIDRVDGSVVHWRVERLEEHPKDAFPTDAVYGSTAAPTLRLITCSGAFDPEARSYESNTIVFLALDPDRPLDRPSGAERDRPRQPPAAEGAGPTARDPSSRGAAAVSTPGDGTEPDGGGSLPRAARTVADGRADADPQLAGAPASGGGRTLPIALAVVCLVAAGTAVGRELRAAR